MSTQTKTKLRPLADRVLLRQVEVEETMSGGIILPESTQQKQQMGVVIAVGPGKKDKDGNHIEINVKPGDKVMWDKYGGQEVTVDEENFTFVKADDIIATIEE